MFFSKMLVDTTYSSNGNGENVLDFIRNAKKAQPKLLLSNETSIADITKSSRTAEHDDESFEHCSPVICHEEQVSLGCTEDGFNISQEEKSKEEWKKQRSINTGKKKLGRQRGQGKTCQNCAKQPSRCGKNEKQQVTKQGRNSLRHGRENGDGEESDSDNEYHKRKKPHVGQYAGLPEEDDKDENEVESIEEQATGTSCSDPQPINNPQTTEAIEKDAQKILERVNEPMKQISTKVKDQCVHICYSKCSGCHGDCIVVNKLFTCLKRCPHHKICKAIELGLYLHARDCSMEINCCPVHQCNYWKTWLERRKERRLASGEISFSTTSIFKEGSLISEDFDYTFLYKVFLGMGTSGDVWRVWIYFLKEQREADIACKELRYDPTEEIRIYHAIRQNHPNLLSPMAVIQFRKPQIFSDRKRSIYGYLLMENAECTIFHLKRQYNKDGFDGLPIDYATYLLYQVAQGLRYLHSKGIVHKDIKDLNVLLFNHCQLAKIADWDSAIFIRDEAEFQRTKGIPPKGTPGFCAPEVLNKAYHSFPADIYSLAAMFLEILYGGIYKKARERAEDQVRRLKDAIEKLQEKRPTLGQLIKKCLLEEQRKRPTALDLVKHDCLMFEQDYKVPFPQRQEQYDTRVEPIKFPYLVDTELKECEAFLQRCEQIDDKPPEDIERMMDALDKVLPTENLPQSSTWIGQLQVEEPQFDIDMEEAPIVDAMETS